MTRRTWIIISAFLAAQLVAVVLFGNGPFIDEGLYITAGARIVTGLDDNYLWFGGCPYLLPLVLGAGYIAGGLAGARMVVVLCYAASLVFFTKFCVRRFGEAASFWALLLLCLNGIVFSFAHLAVYDAAAFLGCTVCLWANGELAESGRTRDAVVAAVSAALAIMARHATFIVVLPTLALAALPSDRLWPRGTRYRRVAFVCASTATLLVAYLLISYRSLIPPASRAWVSLSGVIPRPILAFGVVYVFAVPLVLGAWALGSFGRKQPLFTAAMAAVSLVGPLIHVAFALHVSFHKDLTFCLLYLYPFAGVTLARLWRRQPALAGVVAGVAGIWGGAQTYWEDHSWADIRSTAQYLLPQVPTGRHFVTALEYGWAFRMYAVLEHGATSPADVVDTLDLDRGRSPCNDDWIIGMIGGLGDAGDRLFRAAGYCGFEEVRRFDSDYFYAAPPAVQHKLVQFVLFKNPHPKVEDPTAAVFPPSAPALDHGPPALNESELTAVAHGEEDSHDRSTSDHGGNLVRRQRIAPVGTGAGTPQSPD